MDEPGCCEPRADKNGEQIHQLDGITVQRDKKQDPQVTEDPVGRGFQSNSAPLRRWQPIPKPPVFLPVIREGSERQQM